MPIIKRPRKVRRDPRHGTIIRVLLPSGQYAYLCAYQSIHYWLYDFLTDYPVCALKYFDTKHWKAPLTWSRLLSTYRDVCRLSLPDRQSASLFVWTHTSDPEYTTGIRVYDPIRGCHRMGTAEEIKGMHKYVWLHGAEIIPWIRSQENELRLISVPPEDRDSKADAVSVDDAQGWAADEPRVIEIQVPDADPTLFARRDDLEYELVGELKVAQCGDECGHGSMGDFAFDIAVTVEPRRIKTALRVIRRVLKKYKVPDSAWIREFDPESEEPIEHPLEPPPKSKCLG